MKDQRALILTLTPVALVIIISFLLQFIVLSDTQAVKTWLLSWGPSFILVYITLQTLAIVVAPIGGAFIWLPMMAVMGPAKGIIISYLVTTPAYFINFYLAKRFGRTIVRRLVGQKGLEKIDHLAADAGTATFVIFKVLQGGYFDYVSYAAGLTKMPWKTFSIVNIVGGLPSAVITYFTLSRFNNFLVGVLVFYAVTGCLIALSIYINHKISHHAAKR